MQEDRSLDISRSERNTCSVPNFVTSFSRTPNVIMLSRKLTPKAALLYAMLYQFVINTSYVNTIIVCTLKIIKQCFQGANNGKNVSPSNLMLIILKGKHKVLPRTVH